MSLPVLEMQLRIEHLPRPVGITEEIILRYCVVIGVVNGHAHDSVSSQNPVTFPQDSADVAWIDVLQRACGGDAVHRVSCQPGRASITGRPILNPVQLPQGGNQIDSIDRRRREPGQGELGSKLLKIGNAFVDQIGPQQWLYIHKQLSADAVGKKRQWADQVIARSAS